MVPVHTRYPGTATWTFLGRTVT